MIVTIRVQPSQHGGGDEYVRLADPATMGEIFEELAVTAQHYTRIRDRYHRATAWSSSGKMLATVGVSPDALPLDQRNTDAVGHGTESSKFNRDCTICHSFRGARLSHALPRHRGFANWIGGSPAASTSPSSAVWRCRRGLAGDSCGGRTQRWLVPQLVLLRWTTEGDVRRWPFAPSRSSTGVARETNQHGVEPVRHGRAAPIHGAAAQEAQRFRIDAGPVRRKGIRGRRAPPGAAAEGLRSP